jgi:hypothetical protein
MSIMKADRFAVVQSNIALAKFVITAVPDREADATFFAA